jgi:hypothetical protein
MATNKKYKIFVDAQVDRKLAVHVEFLARVSESAAISLYIEYKNLLDFLKNSPASCPPYIPQKPINTKLKYKLFGKRYRIVFEIIDNAVYAYDIQDCSQGTGKSLI